MKPLLVRLTHLVLTLATTRSCSDPLGWNFRLPTYLARKWNLQSPSVEFCLDTDSGGANSTRRRSGGKLPGAVVTAGTPGAGGSRMPVHALFVVGSLPTLLSFIYLTGLYLSLGRRLPPWAMGITAPRPVPALADGEKQPCRNWKFPG